MLSEFLKEAFNSNHKDYILTALITYNQLSSFDKLSYRQLMTVKEADYEMLLKIWTDKRIITSLPFSTYCMSILASLLKKSGDDITVLIQLSIVDRLVDVIDRYKETELRLVHEAITLTYHLIESSGDR